MYGLIQKVSRSSGTITGRFLVRDVWNREVGGSNLSRVGTKSGTIIESLRTYARPTIRNEKLKKEPRIRYLFYMFLLSSATIFIAGKQVDKKRKKNSFGSERELNEYELTTGLKRRTKLINHDDYTFIGLPFANEKVVEKLVKDNEGVNVRIIDPDQLIESEKADETKRYSFLLQDLAKENKPLPQGLITALIKEYVSFYMNTTQGTYDTVFIIKNYPQTMDDASKFETDVAFLNKLVVLKGDLEGLDEDKFRMVNDLVSYFETVGKSEVLEAA